ALGFVAVIVPLAVLLALQYVWLVRLQEMSVIAHQAALRGYLDAVGWQVHQEIRERAGALELPAATPPSRLRGILEERWAAHPLDGVTRLFIMDFSRDVFGNLLFFDPETRTLISPAASDEALAIIVTCNPWQLDVYRGEAVEERGLVVDERDPERRMLLRPLLDAHDHLVAIVGMILDEEWFGTEFVPGVARRELETDFPDYVSERLTLVIRDGRDREVARVASGGGVAGEDSAYGGPREADEASGDAKRWARGADVVWSASTRLPFVYTDWSLVVETPGLEVERWARTGFLFNMTVSVLLALLLLGGVALALRAANRAVRLSEMKTDFVSNVSHELRTPLASIRAFGEFLKLGRVSTGKVREYGEHIEAESRRLSRLIDNILDFSRIESGSRSYRFDRGRLEDVVDSVVDVFRVRTRERGFVLEWERPAEPLPELDLDADAIGQVLHNLLDNAVKYSGESRRIEVRVERDADSVSCVVRDEGIGISRDEQAKVFDRFHRVGTGLVHDVKGAGLGLAIVQHVVAAHDGGVDLTSEPGRGTTVRVRLPVPPDAEG
ncbi:HAMP domain-containing histidine kinase, partial [bacterium]|nr:HAMP domain-containing histidine kinase [bacterium]